MNLFDLYTKTPVAEHAKIKVIGTRVIKDRQEWALGDNTELIEAPLLRTSLCVDPLSIPTESIGMVFSSYEIEDDGVRLYFSSGKISCSVVLTFAELSAVTTQAQLKTAVTAKLQQKLRATSLMLKLDQLIGQSITI